MKKNDYGYILTLIAIGLVIVLIVLFSSFKIEDKEVTTTTTTTSSMTTKEVEKVITSTTSTTSTTTTTVNLTEVLTTKNVTTSTTTKKKTTSKATTTKKTTKQSTTKKTTKKTTTAKYVVSEDYEYADAITYKYGVKITTTKKYYVTKYSDGTQDKKYISESSVYDRSNFNATTEDLLPEVNELVANNKSTYNELLGYLNGYREEAGVSPLTMDNELNKLATIRALETAWAREPKDIAHTRPDGRSWSTVFTDMNYDYLMIGENIAAGQTSASKVSTAWKNSSGHYKNMVNTEFTKVGFGYAKVNGKKYWVQLFAK